MGGSADKGGTFRELMDGEAFAYRYPGYRFWAYAFCALFFFFLAAMALYPVIAGSVAPGTELAEQAETAGLFLLFAGAGMFCLLQLPRLRRTYTISDFLLVERRPSGKVTAIALKDVSRLHFSYLRNAQMIVSSAGARIALHNALPGSLLMDGFAAAAYQLRQTGAAGVRLIEMLESALAAGKEARFQERDERAETKISILVMLAAGILLIWYPLIYAHGPKSAGWQILGPLGGAVLIGLSAFVAWLLISTKPQTVVIRRQGLEIRERRGERKTIPLTDIGPTCNYDNSFAPVAITDRDGRDLTILSAGFPEIYAVVYFIEHMRLKVPEDTGTSL